MKRDLPEPRDADERTVLRDVAESGCHIIGVLPDATSPTEPPFAYSIGLFHHYGHPEILIFGLGYRLMHTLINALSDRIQKGSGFLSGPRYSDILQRFDCEFRTVHPSHYRELLGYARWFYGGDDFPVLQCIWPDKQGQFPWESGFDTKLLQVQPIHEQSA